jgi:hypothetical protein
LLTLQYRKLIPALDAKVTVLKTASIILSSKSSQRYCLAQTLIKTQKHHDTSSMTAKTKQNKTETSKRNLFYLLGCLPTSAIVLCP